MLCASLFGVYVIGTASVVRHVAVDAYKAVVNKFAGQSHSEYIGWLLTMSCIFGFWNISMARPLDCLCDLLDIHALSLSSVSYVVSSHMLSKNYCLLFFFSI